MLLHFPKIRSNDNLEVVQENFEDVLKQAEIAQDEWGFHLKTILTGKYADLLHSLKLLHDTTYSKAKHILLEAGDYTATSAGI